MSFNYNPLSSAIPPMHLIAPSTSSFLPKLPAQLLAAAAAAANSPQKSGQASGHGPMELENPNDNQQSSCDDPDCENNPSNNDLLFNGMIPQSFMMLPGVMMDPSLLGLQQFPILNLPQTQAQAEKPPQQADTNSTGSNGIVKEVIHCSSCTLIPPNPNAPPPSTRERPPGCRTVFVGGLPENITEVIIHEIFERCGEITTLRLSKKNFCHIRFVFEASVDSAIYLSGYRVKIGNNNDPSNTGRLHVDYAQARDDQYEYECKLRQLQREQRHREKDRLRSSSPPSIAHYTDHEATNVAEKIKNDETFLKAVQTLVTWLERGDCSKKNANIFYSMIQSANSHIRRLMGEKNQYEDEYEGAKSAYRSQMSKTVEQFNQIEKVFNAASHKKVWDHFTKAQRKNIDQWCKMAMDTKTFKIDEPINDNNDEMDLSDDEGSSKSSKRMKLDASKRKDERSTRSLSRDAKSDIEVSREQKTEAELKGKQIKLLQETIRNLQRKLIETSTKEKQNEVKIAELEESIRESNVKELLLRTKIANVRSTSQSVDDLSETSSIVEKSHANVELANDEAVVVSLATAYLVIHPQGATIEAILEYIHEFNIDTTENEVVDVLVKHEKVFSIDAAKKWHFCGFKLWP